MYSGDIHGGCRVEKVNIAEATETIHEFAFSQEELDELEQTRTVPIVFDEDCPEVTPEQAVKFRRINPIKRVAN